MLRRVRKARRVLLPSMHGDTKQTMRQVFTSIRMSAAVVLLTACVLACASAHAAQFASLHSFSGTDGETPAAALVQGVDGAIYGVAAHGGNFAAVPPDGAGTIFRKQQGAPLVTLHVFNGADGATPNSLIQAADGTFYGTTSFGGPPAEPAGNGTIFRVEPTGGITTLYVFPGGSGGAFPRPIVQGIDGALYGTAYGGIEIQATQFGGFVFRFDPVSREMRRLHEFGGPDGRTPLGPLFQAGDGFFYGTSQRGGAANAGVVYKVDANGVFSLMHALAAGFPSEGSGPKGGVVQASDGNFYGTTEYGTYYGTIFRMDASGNYSVLHRFDSYASTGSRPLNGLVEGSDGFLYGTTSLGGAPTSDPNRNGVVYRMDLSGIVQVLHTFTGSDGASPWAGVIQGVDGAFYGSTIVGGSNSLGTLFRLSVAPAEVIFSNGCEP